MKKRKILIEVTVHWENYDDVDAKLILEDANITKDLKEGVDVEIIDDSLNDDKIKHIHQGVPFKRDPSRIIYLIEPNE